MHCCICSKVCGHSTPPSYCLEHTTLRNSIVYNIYNTGKPCECDLCNNSKEHEYAIRERIAKEIELQCSSKCDIKDWVDDSPVKVCSHKEDAAIARGQK